MTAANHTASNSEARKRKQTAIAAAILGAARDARENGDEIAYVNMLAVLDNVDPTAAATLRAEQ